MQAQGFIQDIGYDVNNFWQESNALAKANDMDTNLAYMYKMVEKSQGNFRLDKKILADYGAKVELFPGVKTWFKRIPHRRGGEPLAMGSSQTVGTHSPQAWG